MGILAFLFARPLSFQRIAHWAALGLLAGLVVSFTIVRGQRDDARDALSAEQDAHALTRANYRAAAAMARNMAQARVDRVEASSSAINEEISHDFTTRIADARARAARPAGRVRHAAAPAGAGSDGGAAAVSGISDAARGADASPADAGFCVAGPGADAALIASEQAIQLDALIDWIEAQQRLFREELDNE